jgi:hypothetical protein
MAFMRKYGMKVVLIVRKRSQRQKKVMKINGTVRVATETISR